MREELFSKGQRLWVHSLDAEPRAAVYMGCDDRMYRGAVRAYVVFEDTRRLGEIEIDRLTARE